MTDATNRDAVAESDLAYLKRLAAAGRGAPAPFLLLMAVFGGAYGLWATLTCLLVLFAFVQGNGAPAFSDTLSAVSGVGFIAANIAFLAGLGWTLWQTFGPRRVAVSRAAVAIWSAAFIGLVCVVGAAFASAGQPHGVFDAGVISSALLILWGVAWWATAIVADRRWLISIAMGSFAAAIALPMLGTSFWGFPIMAACLIFLAFLPAMVLMRAARK